MKIDGLTHPKTKELALTLEIPLPHAIGLLELLWAFVAQQTPQGNVGKWSNGVIASEAGWLGDADLFVNALIDIRYLDHDETHRLLVHDWKDHAPNWVHAKLKKKNMDFIYTIQQPILDTIPEATKIDENTIPEATTSLAKPSHAKAGQGSYSVPNGTGAKAPDFWKEGKTKLNLPGELIGRWIKRYSEAKVRKAIAQALSKPPADPKAWIEAYLQDRPKNTCPDDPDEIEQWAKENGHPIPRPGETTGDYKRRISNG